MVSYLKILTKCVGIPVLKNLYPDPDPGVLKSMQCNQCNQCQIRIHTSFYKIALWYTCFSLQDGPGWPAGFQPGGTWGDHAQAGETQTSRLNESFCFSSLNHSFINSFIHSFIQQSKTEKLVCGISIAQITRIRKGNRYFCIVGLDLLHLYLSPH